MHEDFTKEEAKYKGYKKNEILAKDLTNTLYKNASSLKQIKFQRIITDLFLSAVI